MRPRGLVDGRRRGLRGPVAELTRRVGDFACRGIHTLSGHTVTDVPTPRLAALRCHWCGDRGVTVTAATDRADGKLARLYGWCGVQHARASGVVVPAGAGRGQ